MGLEHHTDEALRHAKNWLAALEVQQCKLNIDTTPLPSKSARIFYMDAERTFKTELNKNAYIKLLHFAHMKFGDYQQSMGYVAGLLMLFFDPATVLKALTVLNDSPKYLAGYWRGEATSCAVDGYVCFHFLKTVWGKPLLHEKLLRLGVLPETFVQKWFAGICIHHMPYHILFVFLDNFFAGGNRFLFQFFGAFMTEFEQDLLDMASNPEAFQLIRLETASEARLLKVIEDATTQKLEQSIRTVDIHALRCQAFKEFLSQRLQRANEALWETVEEEIQFSDESSNPED